MKNDILKKTGQFRNVRVEYGFGAVCGNMSVSFIAELSPVYCCLVLVFNMLSCFLRRHTLSYWRHVEMRILPYDKGA